ERRRPSPQLGLRAGHGGRVLPPPPEAHPRRPGGDAVNRRLTLPHDPVRYGSVTAPTGSPVAQRRCPICGGEPAGPRATYCSAAPPRPPRSAPHRQSAYRLRQSAPPPPPRRPPRHQVVYQCPSCEERYLGVQRCESCNVFCLRLDVGGLCVHCDQPVAVSDLL